MDTVLTELSQFSELGLMGIDKYSLDSHFIVFCSSKTKISGFFFGLSLLLLWFQMVLSMFWFWFRFFRNHWFWLALEMVLWFSLVHCSPLVWSLVSSFESSFMLFILWSKTTVLLNLSLIQKVKLFTSQHSFWMIQLLPLMILVFGTNVNVNSTHKLKNYGTDVMIVTDFFFATLLHSQGHTFFHSYTTLTATSLGTFCWNSRCRGLFCFSKSLSCHLRSFFMSSRCC